MELYSFIAVHQGINNLFNNNNKIYLYNFIYLRNLSGVQNNWYNPCLISLSELLFSPFFLFIINFYFVMKNNMMFCPAPINMPLYPLTDNKSTNFYKETPNAIILFNFSYFLIMTVNYFHGNIFISVRVYFENLFCILYLFFLIFFSGRDIYGTMFW